MAGFRFEEGDKYPDICLARMVDDQGKLVADEVYFELNLGGFKGGSASGMLVHKFQNIMIERAGLHRAEIVIDNVVRRILPLEVLLVE